MMRSVFLVGAAGLLLAPLVLQAQQPAGPTRDTVVVMRRDTVVIVRRDTVFLQAQPQPQRTPEEELTGPRLPPGRGGGGYDYDYRETPEERRERLLDARRNRVERLEQMRAEREAYFASLPPARPNEHAFAVMLYPTRLLELEFPSVNVGVSYVKNGRAGLMASFGFLTAPLSGRNFDGTQSAVARGSVRGFDLGLEGRYYISPLRSNFPMYFGIGGSYSVAAVTFDRFIPNPANTFERLSEADAQGRRIRGTALVGWELRTGGFALDLTTGVEIGGRGIFTSNAGLVREINREFWNANRANRYNPQVLPIMRIGIGIGKW